MRFVSFVSFSITSPSIDLKPVCHMSSLLTTPKLLPEFSCTTTYVGLCCALCAAIDLHLVCSFTSGVSKLRPAGQIRPAKRFNPAREVIFIRPQRHFANNENLMYLRKTCRFGRMQHIPKQSHYVRCLALELL